MQGWTKKLEVAATVLFMVVCVVLIWVMLTDRRASVAASPPKTAARTPPPRPVPTEPISLEGAKVRGNPSARLTLVEFSDFQCPICGTFARNTWPEFVKKYVDTGRILVGFRHLPLTSIHKFALGAASAAECAAGQGRFWEMSDRLFDPRGAFDTVLWRVAAKDINLDLNKFDSCMTGPSDRVRSDLAIAAKLGIAETPTFLLGVRRDDGTVAVSQRFVGALPIDRLAAIVDPLLK